MENKLWITFFLMLASMAGWEANNIAEDIAGDIQDPVECPRCKGNTIIAYVNNCETGAQDRYICEDIAVDANCINTEEILTELG